MRLRWLERVAVRHCLAFSADPRPLTACESGYAEEVFGAALDLAPVRVVRASIVNSPSALGNVIRIPPGFEIDPVTLIHELAHVWQYQTRGPEYISSSVWHQAISIWQTGSRGEAYHVTWEDLAAGSIHDLPAEKQAVIIERWYAHPHLRQHPDFDRLLTEVRRGKSS